MTSPTHSLSTISVPSGRFSAPINIARPPQEEETGGIGCSYSDQLLLDDGSSCDGNDDLYLEHRSGRRNNSQRRHEIASSYTQSSDIMAYSLSDAESMQRHRDMLRAMGDSSRRPQSNNRRSHSDRNMTGSAAQSLPAPRAPFLSSQRLNDEHEKLSSIPAMSLPDSVVSSSWNGVNKNGGYSVPYGSLRSSSFQSRHMHSTQEHGTPRRSTSVRKAIPKTPSLLAQSLPTQSSFMHEVANTLPANRGGNQPLSSGIGAYFDKLKPAEEEESKRHDSSSQGFGSEEDDSALQQVCSHMDDFQLDESASDVDTDGAAEAELLFGQSLTALGVMEFTRTNKEEGQANIIREKRGLAQSLGEDQMMMALQQWAARSYHAKGGAMGLLSSCSDRISHDERELIVGEVEDLNKPNRRMSDILELSRPSSVNSSSFHHDLSSSAEKLSPSHIAEVKGNNFLLERTRSHESILEHDSELGCENPDTFEAFEFELE